MQHLHHGVLLSKLFWEIKNNRDNQPVSFFKEIALKWMTTMRIGCKGKWKKLASYQCNQKTKPLLSNTWTSGVARSRKYILCLGFVSLFYHLTSRKVMKGVAIDTNHFLARNHDLFLILSFLLYCVHCSGKFYRFYKIVLKSVLFSVCCHQPSLGKLPSFHWTTSVAFTTSVFDPLNPFSVKKVEWCP